MTGTILTVCTGNVCRSPYLHRRLELALAGSGIRVHSAGTGALADHPMDPSMAQFLGADADPAFRARQLTKQDVLSANLVLTATRAHRTLVTQLAPRALRTTATLADFAQLADLAISDSDWRADHEGAPLAQRVVDVLALRPHVAPLPPEKADVPDPYRAGHEVYRESAAMIDSRLPSVLSVLR